MLTSLWVRILVSVICGLILSVMVAGKQHALKPLPVSLLLFVYGPSIYAGFFYTGYAVTSANVLRFAASFVFGTAMLTLGGYLLAIRDEEAFQPSLERFVWGALLFSGLFFNGVLKPIM